MRTSKAAGSEPTAMPPADTFGQDTLISNMSAGLCVSFSATWQ